MVACVCPWRIVENFLENPTRPKTATAPPLLAPLSAVPANNSPEQLQTLPLPSASISGEAEGTRLLGWAQWNMLVPYDLILSAHPIGWATIPLTSPQALGQNVEKEDKNLSC